MKKTKYFITVISIISVLLIYFYFDTRITTKSSSDDNNSQTYIVLSNTSSDPSTIYSEEYQDKMDNQIENLKQKNNYTFSEPLLIENPYGTNTTGIYMYFTTDSSCQAKYTISCDGYDDFTNILNTNTSDGFTKNHEYLLIGSIPGKKNTITVTLTDKQGQQLDTLSWSYQAPNLLGGDEYVTVDTTTNQPDAPLANGLYTVLGNDVTEESDDLAYLRLYDNNGIIRSEIPIIS